MLMLIYLLKNSVGENIILNAKSITLLWSLNRSMVLLPIISEKNLLSVVALPITL